VWPEKISLRFILFKPIAQKGVEELSVGEMQNVHYVLESWN
jgi:hypothetical protein